MRSATRTTSVIAAAAFALAACAVEDEGDPLNGDVGGTDDVVEDTEGDADSGGGAY